MAGVQSGRPHKSKKLVQHADLLLIGVSFCHCLHHAKQSPILIRYLSHTLLNNLEPYMDRRSKPVRTEVITVVSISVLDLLPKLGDLVVCRFERFFEVAFEPSSETAGDLLQNDNQRGYSCNGNGNDANSKANYLDTLELCCEHGQPPSETIAAARPSVMAALISGIVPAGSSLTVISSEMVCAA